VIVGEEHDVCFVDACLNKQIETWGMVRTRDLQNYLQTWHTN
jgi:hypothetical protein